MAECVEKFDKAVILMFSKLCFKAKLTETKITLTFLGTNATEFCSLFLFWLLYKHFANKNLPYQLSYPAFRFDVLISM